MRIPLAELTIAGNDTDVLVEFADLISDEINVKKVTFSTDLDAFAARVPQAQRQAARSPDSARVCKTCFAAATRRAMESRTTDGNRSGRRNTRLPPTSFEIALEPATDGAVWRLELWRTRFVVLDTDLTPELVNEGHARPAVSMDSGRPAVQFGLDVTDRIALDHRHRCRSPGVA